MDQLCGRGIDLLHDALFAAFFPRNSLLISGCTRSGADLAARKRVRGTLGQYTVLQWLVYRGRGSAFAENSPGWLGPPFSSAGRSSSALSALTQSPRRRHGNHAAEGSYICPPHHPNDVSRPIRATTLLLSVSGQGYFETGEHL